MPDLIYGQSAYRREAGGLPEIRLVNMLVERTPTAEQAVALLSRPGLAPYSVVATGPVRGLFTQAGTLGNSLFAVGGDHLYDGATDRGQIAGTGPVSFAGSATELLVTAGATLYRSDGGAVQPAGFPDNASVTAAGYLAGLFIGIRAGTHRFYWSGVRDALSWDGLDYASAESSPDPLLDLVVVGDVLWLLGSASIEPWQVTGDADLPFSRIEAHDYQRGVIATGCAAEMDNTLFWIGDDYIVYRGAQVPQRVSDHGIEERIAASLSWAAFKLEFDGHKLFCVRLDSGAFCFDIATGQWCEFSSFGLPSWGASCAVEVQGRSIVGSADSGRILRMDSMRYDDDGGVMMRLFTALAPVNSGGATLDVIHLDAEFGATPLLTGQGADPQIEVRASRDAGRTWAGWRQATLGRQGEYRARSAWRRFGTFDAPGAMFEFRVTDPVPLRVSTVKANETIGGRSRG